MDRLVDPLGDCLNLEAAKALIALKPDPAIQKYMDEMASRNTEGSLTFAEREDYTSFVCFSTFVAILKSKARRKVAAHAKKNV